jgi:hypothetical protein
MAYEDQPTEEFDEPTEQVEARRGWPAAPPGGTAASRDLQQLAWRGTVRRPSERAPRPWLSETAIMVRPAPAPTVQVERTWSFERDTTSDPAAALPMGLSQQPLSEREKLALMLGVAIGLGMALGVLLSRWSVVA